MHRMWNWAVLSACLLALYPAAGRAADAFPTRPVQLLVGFGPGGGVDLFARRVGQKLGERWGKPIVVVNKPGADSSIAADYVAHAAPDGYTLLMVSNSQALPPAGSPPPYDPLKSFSPIILAAANGTLLVVSPTLPVHSLKDLIALAKSEPGKLNFGNPGIGGPPYVATETLLQATGTKMTSVPFTGGAAALTSLMGGEIQVLFSTVTAAAELVKAGKVRALAISTDARSPRMPDVPTVAEAANLPGFSVTGWFGLLGPPNMPPALVNQIHDDVAAVLALPDIKADLAKEDFSVIAGSPAQFSTFLAGQITSVAQVMKAAGP